MRLSKLQCVSVLVLLLLAPAAAQAAGAVLGARAGVSVASASLDVNETFSSDNRTGFAGTIFLDLGSALLNLQPEASYVQKGIQDGNTGETLELDYFELAGLLKVGLPIPVVQPHLFGGIGADFRVQDNIPADVTFSAKNADWNLIFGADVKFGLGKVILYGDGRYALGLTDVTEASDVVQDMKNRAWIFSAGVGLPF
jgi:hypothetical protein